MGSCKFCGVHTLNFKQLQNHLHLGECHINLCALSCMGDIPYIFRHIIKSPFYSNSFLFYLLHRSMLPTLCFFYYTKPKFHPLRRRHIFFILFAYIYCLKTELKKRVNHPWEMYHHTLTHSFAYRFVHVRNKLMVVLHC